MIVNRKYEDKLNYNRRETLTSLIQPKNIAYYELQQSTNGLDAIPKKEDKHPQKQKQDGVILAKARWHSKLYEEIYDININPCIA